MKRAFLPACALSLLTACAGSNAAGPGLRVAPLTAEVARPCPRPEAVLAPISWEAVAGRLGDALIECGAEKSSAVEAYRGVREALGAN